MYGSTTIYKLRYTFAHTGSSLALNFSASGLSDEFWALDNLLVTTDSAGVAPAAPDRLTAQVGDRTIYLQWDAGTSPVDGYGVSVERSTDGFNFALLGTFPSESICLNPGDIPCLHRIPVARVWFKDNFPPLNSINLLVPVSNSHYYRIRVNARKDGLDSPPSNSVVVRPGGFALSQTPKRPILFLHGFMGDSDTFAKTIDFMERTLGWYGAALAHSGSSLTPVYRLREKQRPGVAPDFFSGIFGNSLGHYPNLPLGQDGIVHQGIEVASFINFLKQNGVKTPLTIIAHSNGGLAARSYLVNPSGYQGLQWNITDVKQLITYGTPHLGADFRTLVDAFFSVPQLFLSRLGPVARLAFESIKDLTGDTIAETIQGARDADFSCSGGRIVSSEFLQHINFLLPDHAEYVSIYGNFPLARRIFQDCQSRRWDGLVPTSSADLNRAGFTLEPVRSIGTDELHIGQGDDFASILCALDSNCLQIDVMSPVNVEVTAPNARSLFDGKVEIPGAKFMRLESEHEDDEETKTHDSFLIPYPEPGMYTLKVIPKPGASPTDSYSIRVTRDGESTLIADAQLVQNIPVEPYVLDVPLNVKIDIKPGGTPNPIDLRSNGSIPVAVISTETFDVASIDLSTVRFGRSGNDVAPLKSAREDVNSDGRKDMVYHFETKRLAIQCGDAEARLTARTLPGYGIKGSDSIKVIGCK